MRTKVSRPAVITLRRRAPFEPFVLNMENGDRIVIEHPENIAFDPGGNGSAPVSRFSVVSRQLFYIGSFEAVTSVALVDTGERVA